MKKVFLDTNVVIDFLDKLILFYLLRKHGQEIIKSYRSR